MGSDDNRRKIADQFARLGGRGFGLDGFDFTDYLRQRPGPTGAMRPAKVTASVEDRDRFHVAPESKVLAYLELGWVSRATIKSDGRPIARVLEWPGAAVNPDDVGPHPGEKKP